MNVLVDRHHGDLFFAMQLLFETRLGGVVYTPVGLEWFDSEYWAFGRQHLGCALAEQYLRIDAKWTRCGDRWMTFDPAHPERPIFGVTLDEFRQMNWQFVVATVPDNQQGFRRAADESGAKFVVQVGNTGQYVAWDLNPFVILSAEVQAQGSHVLAHQEFEGKTIFRFRAPTQRRAVASFVNCASAMGCYGHLLRARALLSDWDWAIHGISGEHGVVNPVAGVAERMADCSFGWHDKEHGDGYGHVIHNWAAVGRPLVGHARFYAGRLAERLWEDGVTCIDLDRHSIDEVAVQMRAIVADPDRHLAMCRAIRARFDAINFDTEEQQVRALLGL